LIRIHRWEAQRPDPSRDSTGLPMALIRDLDLALWYAGDLPRSVYATAVSGTHHPVHGDVISVHLGFDGGAMALIDYSGCLPGGDGHQAVSVIGSSGAIYSDDHDNRQLVFDGGSARTLLADEGLACIVAMVQLFLARIASQAPGRVEAATREGPALESGLASFRSVRKLADLVSQSLQTGQAMEWRDGQ